MLVCVTGATGFVASHLVTALLSRGYTVRGTVRSLTNEQRLAHLRALPGAAERLQLVEADLLSDGSFDEAVNGVNSFDILHLSHMHDSQSYILSSLSLLTTAMSLFLLLILSFDLPLGLSVSHVLSLSISTPFLSIVRRRLPLR